MALLNGNSYYFHSHYMEYVFQIVQKNRLYSTALYLLNYYSADAPPKPFAAYQSYSLHV